MKVYLDNCCFNRPYDDQAQLKIELETKAKLYIQQLIKDHKLDMITSFMLRYENDQNPYNMRKDAILNFIDQNTSGFVSSERLPDITDTIEDIKRTGIKQKDATHVACAIFAGCSHLITTDIRLLKYKSDKIKVLNPIDFIRELEG